MYHYDTDGNELEECLLNALKCNEKTIDLGNFEFNVALVECVLRHLKHFPNIEEITWSGASEVEALYILKETKEIIAHLNENKEKFKAIKEELLKNEATTDLSQFETIEAESLLTYVRKSLEKHDNISTIIWPQTCLSLCEPDHIELINSIDGKLSENKAKFRELKEELLKNEVTTDLSRFETIEAGSLLTYVLKNIEKLENITNIIWPEACLSLYEPGHIELMNNIDDKLSTNREVKIEALRLENMINNLEMRSSASFELETEEKIIPKYRRVHYYIIALAFLVSLLFIILTTAMITMRKRKTSFFLM